MWHTWRNRAKLESGAGGYTFAWRGTAEKNLEKVKQDTQIRRFLTTGKRNIRIELLFLALGFNLKKRWMKQQKSRLVMHYSEEIVL